MTNSNGNDTVFILTTHGIPSRGTEYYKNLVNRIKDVYQNKIDVLLVVATDETFNNDFNFYSQTGFVRFGIGNAEHTKLVSQLSLIPHDTLVLSCNRGYDVGSFCVGLNYCKDKYKFIVHVHEKSNDNWNSKLVSVCNENIKNQNVDTIIPRQNSFGMDSFTKVDSSDGNFYLIRKHKHLFPTRHDEWRYSPGKMFATKYELLKTLNENFERIYMLLTDENKDDVYWQHNMNDKKIFYKYYMEYKDNAINDSIDEKSHIMRKQLGCKNYLELCSKGFRGIPDLQIEHAIERYIGYLICHDKSISFSE